MLARVKVSPLPSSLGFVYRASRAKAGRLQSASSFSRALVSSRGVIFPPLTRTVRTSTHRLDGQQKHAVSSVAFHPDLFLPTRSRHPRNSFPCREHRERSK